MENLTIGLIILGVVILIVVYNKIKNSDLTIAQQITELNSCFDRTKKLKSELDDNIIQLNQLSEKHKSLQSDNSLLNKNYKSLQSDNSLLQTNYNSLQINYNTLQADNALLNENYNSLQAESLKLQITIDEKVIVINQLNDDINKLNDKMNILISNLDESIKNVDLLQTEKTKLQETIDTLQSQLSQLVISSFDAVSKITQQFSNYNKLNKLIAVQSLYTTLHKSGEYNLCSLIKDRFLNMLSVLNNLNDPVNCSAIPTITTTLNNATGNKETLNVGIFIDMMTTACSTTDQPNVFLRALFFKQMDDFFNGLCMSSPDINNYLTYQTTLLYKNGFDELAKNEEFYKNSLNTKTFTKIFSKPISIPNVALLALYTLPDYQGTKTVLTTQHILTPTNVLIMDKNSLYDSYGENLREDLRVYNVFYKSFKILNPYVNVKFTRNWPCQGYAKSLYTFIWRHGDCNNLTAKAYQQTEIDSMLKRGYIP